MNREQAPGNDANGASVLSVSQMVCMQRGFAPGYRNRYCIMVRHNLFESPNSYVIGFVETKIPNHHIIFRMQVLKLLYNQLLFVMRV
jgi:hypothetical protein